MLRLDALRAARSRRSGLLQVDAINARSVRSISVAWPFTACAVVAVLTTFEDLDSSLAQAVTLGANLHGPPQISPSTLSPLRI